MKEKQKYDENYRNSRRNLDEEKITVNILKILTVSG